MNAIEIKNLCKSYGDFSLDNINLTLPGGCILGLIGENDFLGTGPKGRRFFGQQKGGASECDRD